MSFVHPGKAERRGFTLIELLVVIAIIAILVGLIAAAIIPMMKKGPEMDNINTIRQLSVALETFKQKFGTYPPSQLYLSNQLANYNTAARLQSLNYLNQIWPRLDWTQPINWQGGNGANMGAGVTLQGYQCLVFFLGGIQDATGCRGFSTNPKNPTELPAVNPNRLGPYFEAFQGQRLLTTPAGTFYCYLDPYLKMPYAYFSSGKSANGYVTTDNSNLGVAPYQQTPVGATPTLFYNPNSFQIISAGEDMTFGPGGYVAPGNFVGGFGADDFSNFASGRLGAGL